MSGGELIRDEETGWESHHDMFKTHNWLGLRLNNPSSVNSFSKAEGCQHLLSWGRTGSLSGGSGLPLVPQTHGHQTAGAVTYGAQGSSQNGKLKALSRRLFLIYWLPLIFLIKFIMLWTLLFIWRWIFVKEEFINKYLEVVEGVCLFAPSEHTKYHWHLLLNWQNTRNKNTHKADDFPERPQCETAATVPPKLFTFPTHSPKKHLLL